MRSDPVKSRDSLLYSFVTALPGDPHPVLAPGRGQTHQPLRPGQGLRRQPEGGAGLQPVEELQAPPAAGPGYQGRDSGLP